MVPADLRYTKDHEWVRVDGDIATVGITIAMTFVTVSWLVMTLVMLVMLFMLGPRHPRVIYEHESVGVGRNLIAVFALIMFILCFTPVPIQFQDLVGGR